MANVFDQFDAPDREQGRPAAAPSSATRRPNRFDQFDPPSPGTPGAGSTRARTNVFDQFDAPSPSATAKAGTPTSTPEPHAVKAPTSLVGQALFSLMPGSLETRGRAGTFGDDLTTTAKASVPALRQNLLTAARDTASDVAGALKVAVDPIGSVNEMADGGNPVGRVQRDVADSIQTTADAAGAERRQTLERLSPEAKALDEETRRVYEDEGFLAGVGHQIANPSSIARMAVESGPSTALAMLAGRFGTRGVAAATVPMGAGEAMVGSRDAIQALPEDKLREVPEYRAALESGATPAQARAQLIEQAERVAGMIGAGAGTIPAVPGLNPVEHALTRRAAAGEATGLAQRLAGTRAGQAVREAVGEVPEEVGIQLGTNLGQRTAGLDVDVTDGVAQAAGGALLTGAAMGAVMPGQRAPESAGIQPAVDTAQQDLFGIDPTVVENATDYLSAQPQRGESRVADTIRAKAREAASAMPPAGPIERAARMAAPAVDPAMQQAVTPQQAPVAPFPDAAPGSIADAANAIPARPAAPNFPEIPEGSFSDTAALAGHPASTHSPAPGAGQGQTGVPAMMTRAMRAQLANLGYSADQVRNMTPATAWDVINRAQPVNPSETPNSSFGQPDSQGFLDTSTSQGNETAVPLSSTETESNLSDGDRSARSPTAALPPVLRQQLERSGFTATEIAALTPESAWEALLNEDRPNQEGHASDVVQDEHRTVSQPPVAPTRIEPLGTKGMLVHGDPTQVRQRLAGAGFKPKGRMHPTGALQFDRKHQAAIEAALNATAPASDVETAPESAAARAVAGVDAQSAPPPPVVDQAAQRSAVSPTTGRPEPTDTARDMHLNGLDVSIETPAGSRRRPEYEPLKNHYGYIRGTKGRDKDHVDVFLGPKAEDPAAPVFVVDQTNREGQFDEHKVMLGFADEAEARSAYLSNYPKDWTGLGAITRMAPDQFKAWVRDEKATRRPAGNASPTRTTSTDATTASTHPSDPLPAILAQPRKKYLAEAIEQAGVKHGSPGYEQAVRGIEARYDADVEAALADLPFEQYRALNPGVSEAVSRRAWSALRGEPQLRTAPETELEAAERISESKRARKHQAIEDAFHREMRNWGPNQPTVHVVRSPSDYPPAVKREPLHVRAPAGRLGSDVWVATDLIPDVRTALKKLAHEAIGHYGVDNIIDDYLPGGWKTLTADLKAWRTSSTLAPSIRTVRDNILRNYVRDGEPTSDEEFAREMVAHMAEEGLRNSVTGRVVAAVRKFLRQSMPSLKLSDAEIRQTISELIAEAGAWVRRPMPLSNEPRAAATMAFSADRPSFADQVRERLASGDHRGAPLDMGRTPAVLRMLGFPDLPLQMPSGVLFKLATGKHGERAALTDRQIAKLPELIDEPAAVLRSATDQDSVVVAIDAKDSTGAPIVVAVAMDRAAPGNPVLRVNVLTSAYGKTDTSWFQREAAAGRALYADQEKALGRQVGSGAALHSSTEQGGQGPGAILRSPIDLRNFRAQQRSARTDKPDFALAWHGSPQRGIEREGFKLNKIGTGEGQQAFGWGVYFASQREIAEHYHRALSDSEVIVRDNQGRQFNAWTHPHQPVQESAGLVAWHNGDVDAALAELNGKIERPDADPRDVRHWTNQREMIEGWRERGIEFKPGGQLYSANIPDDHELMDWDATLSEQPKAVRNALAKAFDSAPERALADFDVETTADLARSVLRPNADGRSIYDTLIDVYGSPRAASDALGAAGIPGLRYLDGDSRAGQGDSRNYVIWDEALLTPDRAQITPHFSLADPVESPAFQNWFKDSQVTVAGKPRVVYHGTAAEFEAFDPTLLGESTAHMTAPLGFYFAEDRAKAERYAQKASQGVPADERLIEAYLSIQNPAEMNLDAFMAVDSTDEARALRAWQEQRGHDGIHLKDIGQWIAFRPEQVKSTTNRGTFDPADPRMDFSVADTAQPRTAAFQHLSKDQRQALGKIGAFAPGETLATKTRRLTARWKQKLVQGVFDQFRPLKDLDATAYMQARLSKGTDGALEATFRYGPPQLVDGALDVKADGQGFQGVLADLAGEHDLFMAWIAGNRAERLAAEGRERLFNADEIASLKQLNQGRLPDGRDRKAAYAKALKAFNRYQNALLDIATEAGLINAESRAHWQHEFYVPFYRVMDDDATVGPGDVGGLVGQRAFQRLRGGTEPLGDLLANTLANWSHILSASMKNLAGRKALRAAAAMDVAERVSEPERGSVRVMVEGRPRHYLVSDPLVLDALTMLHHPGWNNPAMKAMQWFKRALTTGVTTSPTFRIRNLIRDTVSAVASNEVGYNPLRNLVDGWKGTRKTSDTYQRLLGGGGAIRFGTLLDGDQAANAKRLIATGVNGVQILDTEQKVKNAFAKAWDWYQYIGDRAESVNRAAIYARARADGKSHLEASFAARDLLDFTMGGKWAAVRFLTQIVPFMNARLQGMYKLGRSAKDDPRRFASVAGAVALASVLLHLANQDDDDYRALPDWVRDTYWWVRLPGTDHALYIPKPFELGALGSVVERTAELITGGDDYTGRDFMKTVGGLLADQLALNPVPQAVKPFMEAAFNRDSFRGRDIDSMSQERLPAGDRYTAQTSAAAVGLGQVIGYSPQRIEHMVRGYFGWLGAQALGVSDLLLRPAMDLPSNPRRDLSRVDNWFVVGDLVKPTAGSGGDKYLTRFYGMQRQISEVYAAYSEARKAGDLVRMRELAGDRRMRLRQVYTGTQNQLTRINQRIRRITNDRRMTAAEKRDLLDGLNAMRNRIAERADIWGRAVPR